MSGRLAARVWSKRKRVKDPVSTNASQTPSRGSPTSCWDKLSTESSFGPLAPTALCIPYEHTTPLHGRLPVQGPDGGKGEPWQI